MRFCTVQQSIDVTIFEYTSDHFRTIDCAVLHVLWQSCCIDDNSTAGGCLLFYCCWATFASSILQTLRRVTSDYSSTLHQSPVAICLWIQMHFPFHEQFINSSFSIGKRFFEFLTSISYNILSRDAEECNICDSTDYSFWTNKYMNNEWRLVTRFFFYYSRLMRNKIRPLLWLCIICSRVRKQRVIIKKQTPNKRASH